MATTRTSRFLRFLVEVSCRRPGLTVAISLLLAALDAASTLHALTFRITTRSLLPQGADYVVRYTEYAKSTETVGKASAA
jgi:uncharacterized membrane protein YdfJ with MMPL/SSD domain